MYRNYLVIAIRGLKKYPLLSGINIFGLGTAVGCCLLVFAFLEYIYNRDTFHEQADRIFMVEYVIDRDGRTQTWGFAPLAFGPALKADFPQVEDAIRIIEGRATVRYGDQVFDERIRYADPGFFNTFTFPLKLGNTNALSDHQAIVISEAMAHKYFGNEDPMGKTLILKANGAHTNACIVTGVAYPQRPDASFGFDFLLPYDRQADFGFEDRDSWALSAGGTFIRLRASEDIKTIQSQLSSYIQAQNVANPDWPISQFIFENILDLSENRHQVRGGIVKGGADPSTRTMLLLLAVCILILACFNYMNIALSTATRRVKEIGIRKAVGSLRGQLIAQFLIENSVLCLIALIFGLWLGQYILIPAFSMLFGGVILTLDMLHNPRIWGFMLGMLVITAIGSGAYPALYISAYQPAKIFQGKQKSSGRPIFASIMLTLQFVLSFVLITIGVGLIQNISHYEQREWGYDQHDLMVVPFNDERSYTLFTNAIQSNANILNMAGSNHNIGKARGSAVVDMGDTKHEVIRFDVGFGYSDIMGLEPVSGRLFDARQPLDSNQSILINETFVRQMQWDNPLGRQFSIGDKPYTVIGVLKDFHYTGFHRTIQPVALLINNQETYRYLTIKSQPGMISEVEASVLATWKRLFPDQPYRGLLQNDVFFFFFQEQAGLASLLSWTAGIALTIACVGFMGLVSLNIAQRMKEFSIRMVYGASTGDVSKLITKELMGIILLSIALAVPLSYYFLNVLLKTASSYSMAINPLPFIIAAVILTGTAWLTILSRIYRVASTNPIEILRYE